MVRMSSPVQIAVETYLRACTEREPGARAALFDACFADDVRMVTRSREIRGRARLIQELEGSLSDPRLARARIASAVDAKGTTFRYRAVAEFHDGTSAESFDAGEIDENGRIALILTFAGPLGDVVDASASA